MENSDLESLDAAYSNKMSICHVYNSLNHHSIIGIVTDIGHKLFFELITNRST
jgi:hypothetical protein